MPFPRFLADELKMCLGGAVRNDLIDIAFWLELCSMCLFFKQDGAHSLPADA